MNPNAHLLPLLGPPLESGDLGSLDGMRIKALLGQGGMALVYLAEDPLLGRSVAVKLIRPEHVEDQVVRDRFLREGRMLSAVQSEHVIRILRVGETDQAPYIVMELLEGSSLDSWLARQRKPVTYTTTCKVARDALRGLGAIHAKGIVHRDIKPSNLWIDRNTAKVCVLDLGLARPIAHEGCITLEGIIGTAAYMSPEQAEGDELDGRSDLFSLGVVLYQMLAGINPFKKENPVSSLIALVTEEPTPLRFCRPDIPAELEIFIHGLLSKDRNGRPSGIKAAFEAVAPLEKKFRKEKRGSDVQPALAPDIAAPKPPSSPLSGLGPDLDRGDSDPNLLDAIDTEAFPAQPKYPFLCGPLVQGDLGSLDGHRMLSLIGRGAMGYVFRGIDKGLGRSVAIKVIRPDLASDPAARRRFLREAKLLASIKSEHVVTVYHAGETPLVPYLVMECLDGAPLDDWLKRQGNRVTPAVACKVVRDTLKGLVVIHKQGMVHRDIKPANLWVERDASRIKVLDFGLTRGPTSEDRSTLAGGILGTPAYMAPEQAAGKIADERSDLFSLGVVFYQMLAGANPFARNSAVASMNAVAYEDPPQLMTVRRDLAPPLVTLVESLLSKDSAHRPASAAAVLEVILGMDTRLRAPSHSVGTSRQTGTKPDPDRKLAEPSPPGEMTDLPTHPLPVQMVVARKVPARLPASAKAALAVAGTLTVLALLALVLRYLS